MNNPEKGKYEVFQLGKDKRCILDTDTVASQRNNNVVVIGGTGSGKTASISNNMILGLENSNAVVICTKKGEIETFSRILKAKGYHVHFIDFMEPDTSEYGYDPLDECKSDDDIGNLAQSIICSDPSRGLLKEPYWEDSAANVLKVLLNYVKAGHYEKGKDMKAMLELMNDFHWLRHDEENNSGKDEEDKENEENAEDEAEDKEALRLEYLQKNHPLHAEMMNLKKYNQADAGIWKDFVSLPDTTGGCVASSLSTPYNKVFGTDIRKIVNKKKVFSFHKLLEPKTVLFIRMSPVSTVQHSFMGIFYSQLFKRLFDLAEKQPNNVLPYHVHVICDDFATGCHVNKFDEHISIFREKGISATILIQSETQLETIYGPCAATTIINNCDTMIYLGGMDFNTCEKISQRLDRPLEEVLNAPIGKEFFFRRGQKPIVTERINYRENKEYLKYLDNARANRRSPGIAAKMA